MGSLKKAGQKRARASKELALGAETGGRALGQRISDHARHQEDKHRRQLEKADFCRSDELTSPLPFNSFDSFVKAFVDQP